MDNCKGCTDIKIGCHAECSTYKSYQENLNAKRESLNKQNDYDKYSSDAHWRRYRACRCL